MKQRILGIDTGTNSLGWAVVDRDENNNYLLIRRGDLIFQEGVKIEKGIESSKAAERTEHRASRRHYFRRRLRKIEAIKALLKYNLCPQLSEDEIQTWKLKKTYPLNDEFMLWQRTNENENKNPYYYRYLCLAKKLDLTVQSDRYILGRAFYHLAQRRGFLSNRLESTDDNETGKVKASISDLSKEIEEAHCTYLGEYFYHLYDQYGLNVKIRNRYTDREEHYKKEFYAICERQSLSEEMIRDFERALYFQRPLKSQRKGVGKCTFEKTKPRCADSHPTFEEFRMLSFINNIKIQTPQDNELRPLNTDEIALAKPVFFRKSKPQFDFEDIAKAIAGKNNYAWFKEPNGKPYLFNYRMSQGVTGCPTTAALISIWGENWKESIAETYVAAKKKNGTKNLDEIINDIWNVLSFFSSKEKLSEFGKEKLQLNEDEAKKFSQISLTHGFASISLSAINKILPYLREGYIYSQAVFLANLKAVVGAKYWDNEETRKHIVDNVKEIISNFNPNDKTLTGTLEFCITDYLQNNFDLAPGAMSKLYHPSMIETYEDAKKNDDGIYQLGSPMTNAVRNPMAMRSLHQVRKVINQLLKEKTIDNNTEVHIEYARELNDANKRKAIADYNKELEKKRANYREEIKKLYKEDQGKEIEPTEEDILKFQFWEEQDRKCVYTGKTIGIADFIGKNPKFDIEHTIPRSVGGDSTAMNMTLCESHFNRSVKGAKMPPELSNQADILERISSWKDKVAELSKLIDKQRTNASMAKDMKDRIIQKKHRLTLERDYWRGKYERFVMKEVPEGFSRRQGAGIGLVSKYAGLYLKSLFHKEGNRDKSNVYVVKGLTSAQFRKMWGLQNAYEKKSRDNHVHHCIDAIVIACIGKNEYDKMARYYHDEERYQIGEGNKPQFEKPWKTFTEDVLSIEKDLLVVHSTPDKLHKNAKKWILTKTGKHLSNSDSVRGTLHNDTYYGAIMKDDQLRYVVRRSLDSLDVKDIKNIVDDKVREIIEGKIAEKGFKEALAEPIYMNKEKGILIKKVRCYAPTVTKPLHIRQQRDLSAKDYKQQYHVMNDSNYLMAIYEGVVKGKVKRDFEIVNNLDAGNFYKHSTNKFDYPSIAPEKSKDGFPLKYTLKIGTHVLLWEKTPNEIWDATKEELCKRLYYVVGLSKSPTTDKKTGKEYLYGNINLRYHQEARIAKDLAQKKGLFMVNEAYRPLITMNHNQFKALVEGVDFEITILGDIKRLR